MADLAINDKGDVLVHDGESWKPAQVAENDKGERVAFDGQSWKPVGSAASARGQAKVGEANTPGNAFGNSFAQGGTLGFADELAAGVRSALPGVSNFMMGSGPLQREGDEQKPAQTVSTAPTFGERYTEELANIRAQQKKDAEEHPTATTAGNIAGNVAVSALALPEFGAMTGAKMLGNAAKFGATGAVLGGVQGFGEGEGGFANRVSNAAPQAATGAVAGAAIPVVGQLIQKALTTAPVRAAVEKGVSPLLGKLADALDYVAPKATAKSVGAAAPDGGQIAADNVPTRLADKLREAIRNQSGGGNPEAVAAVTPPPASKVSLADSLRSAADKTSDMGERAGINQIALALERSKLSPEEAAAKMKALGDEGVLADLGQQFRSTAIGAKVLPGETRDLAKRVLTERTKTYGPKLTEAFTGGEDVPSLSRLGESQQKNISDVGTQAYDTMRASGLDTSPEMQGLIDKSPRIQKLIPQIEQEIVANGGTPNKVDVMHKIKEALGQKANAVLTPDSPYMDKGGIGSLANSFRGAFHEANPAAQMADRAYEHANSLPELTELGRRFMQEGTSPGAVDASATSVADRLASATPFQSEAYAQGVQNAGRAEAMKNPTKIARGLTPEKTDIVQNLTQALGPEGAQRVLNATNTVRTFADTHNALLTGSQTAEKLGDAAELGNARLNITPHGITERITEHLKDALGKIENPNEHVLNKIGEMVLTPDAMKNEEIIQALKKVLAARARGTPVHAGAITATANQASP